MVDVRQLRGRRYCFDVSFVAVCLLVLVGGTGAGSGQLDRLFLQGTQLHRDTLRLTLRGILPFPNEFVEHPRAAADGWRVLQEHDVTLWYIACLCHAEFGTSL